MKILTNDGNEYLLNDKDLILLKTKCDYIKNCIQFNKTKDSINLNCSIKVFFRLLNYFETNKLNIIESDKDEFIQISQELALTDLVLKLHNCYEQYKDLPSTYFELYMKIFKIRQSKQSCTDECLINLFESDVQFKEYDLTLYKSNKSLINNYKYDEDENKNAFIKAEDFNEEIKYNQLNGLYSTFKESDFNNLFIAGGSISNILNPQYNKKINDIDIFIYGLPHDQYKKYILSNMNLCLKMKSYRNELLDRNIDVNSLDEDDLINILFSIEILEPFVLKLCKKICDYFSNYIYDKKNPIIWRTENTITIQIASYYPDIQIIYSRLYSCKSEILLGFDIDSCAWGWDGKNVYGLETSIFSSINRVNIVIDDSRESPSYPHRLTKYAFRGFAPYVPGLDLTKVKYIPVDIRKTGLNRLLFIHDKIKRKYKVYKYNPLNENTSTSNYDILSVPHNSSAIEFFKKLVQYCIPESCNLKELPIVMKTLGRNPLVYMSIIKYSTDKDKNILYHKYSTINDLQTKIYKTHNIINNGPNNVNNGPNNVNNNLKLAIYRSTLNRLCQNITNYEYTNIIKLYDMRQKLYNEYIYYLNNKIQIDFTNLDQKLELEDPEEKYEESPNNPEEPSNNPEESHDPEDTTKSEEKKINNDFEFIYYDYYNKQHKIQLGSIIPQYLRFIIRNPGKQNNGIYAKNLKESFFDQAYGEDVKDFQFDFNQFE